MPEVRLGGKEKFLWAISISLILLLLASAFFYSPHPKQLTAAERRLLGTWHASNGTRFFSFQPDRTCVRLDFGQPQGSSPSTVHARWYVEGFQLRFKAL
jgi:hypothetical protein